MTYPAELASKGRPYARQWLSTTVSLGLYALAWFLLTAIYYKATQSIQINSDNASNVLEAGSILRGNVFLRGWFLPPDTFYSLDTQIDVLLLSLGFQPIVISHLTPAMIYAFLVLTVTSITQYYGQDRVSSLVSSALFVACPIGFFQSLVLVSPIHILTIIIAIILFWFLNRDAELQYSAAFGLTYIATLGDPYFTYLSTLPIVLVSLWRISNRNSFSRDLRVLLSVLLGMVAAGLSVQLIGRFGGYRIASTTVQFVRFSHLAHNFYLYALGLLDVFQSHFFGQKPFAPETLLKVGHASVVVIAAYWGIRHFHVRAGKSADFMTICLTSAALISVAFIFSNMPVNRATGRYLSVMPVLLSLFFGIYYYRAVTPFLRYFAVAISIFGTYSFSQSILTKHQVRYENQKAVLQFLTAHHLKYGFGGYWNSALFTLLSNQRVMVRQVSAPPHGRVEPFLWLANSRWYKKVPEAVFFIIGPTGNFGLSMKTVTMTCGRPTSADRVGEYRIMVFKNDNTMGSQLC